MPDRPPVPAPRDPIDEPDAVTVDVRVARVDLPTPDATILIENGVVIVLADRRVPDRAVERLRQTAVLLAGLAKTLDGANGHTR